MVDVATLDYSDPPNRMAGEEGFKGKTLLITGGTGFIGKVFIEKLLRTCPLVDRIYLLIRTKKGKDPETRLKDIFSGPLYDILKQTRGSDNLKKVVAISGDLLELDLGLHANDRKLITEEVQLIYHLGATVRFDEPFKRAVLLNARGTKFMLELAKECTRLQMFLYCSTAYCFPQIKILHEITYLPPEDPDLVIDICLRLDDEVIEAMSKRLMRNCPNTYTFSKSLAEGIIVKEMNYLPINVIRPSVVIPIWKEPLPGWIDNIYGPTGLLIAAGKGVLRSMYCDPKGFADFVPVDIVANSIMFTTWNFLKNKQKSNIYNITATSEIQVTWEEIITVGKNVSLYGMPYNWVVWYPGGSLKRFKFQHQICAVLFHYIPAIVLDAVIVLTGNKPVLWRVHKKIDAGFELFEFYVNRKWEFNNDKLIKDRKVLNETEKKLYQLDKGGLDVNEYFYNAIHGTRLYLLNEGDETLPTARRHLNFMWFVDRMVRILLLFWCVSLLCNNLIKSSLEF